MLDEKLEKEIIDQFNQKVEEVFEYQKNEFSKISVGRATTKIFDNVLVEYYGDKVPINQTATIKIQDVSNILIVPYEKSTLKDIYAAIVNSKLELRPIDEKEHIRIVIPPLTEERRNELTKRVKEIDEQAKIHLRHIRHDILKKIKNLDNLSENEEKFLEEKFEGLVKEKNSQLEAEGKEKINSIQTI